MVGFISQIALLPVNYKRNVLETHVKFNGIDQENYIFELGNNPYNVQIRQTIRIIPKNISLTLRNYQPSEVWTNEYRLADSENVLYDSIEKNSINFWWVRLVHVFKDK